MSSCSSRRSIAKGLASCRTCRRNSATGPSVSSIGTETSSGIARARAGRRGAPASRLVPRGQWKYPGVGELLPSRPGLQAARFAPENILFDSRNANFIAIIDRHTGHIVWTLGPNFAATERSSKVPRPVDQISGQHDAHLIEAGLPGAGNLLVFDNQGEGGYPPVALGVNSGSRVLEIDPVGKQIVWQYSAESSGRAGWTFYSSFISSARRLPNGNTLIDEGMNGRFFQVTASGKIVWEYVSPFVARTPVGATGTEVDSNWVYRAQPVPYSWLPPGTPHAERAVNAQDLATFHVATAP